MMRGDLLYISFVAAGLADSPDILAGDMAERKPNVVIILADDLGYGELGCYGNTFNETPVLDSLAKRGVMFTNAYASAPISSPSRAGLLSGCCPLRAGITDYIKPGSSINLDPAGFTMLPEILRGNGYHTGIIGKLHLSGHKANGAPVERKPADYGFEEALMVEETSIGNGSYFYPWRHLRSVTGEKNEFLVDRMNREAVGFIERNAHRPFFLFLSHYAVHNMLHGQPELVDHFRGKPGCGHSAPSKGNPENDPYAKWPADYMAKPCNPHLAAQLKVIDEGVGMIVGKLKELGIDKNTLVIFTSDNGGPVSVTVNGPLRGGKGSLYEGGTREPLIIYQPGRICGGRISELPTTNCDFYPTLCQLTGTPLPEEADLDGVSIAGELLGTGECSRGHPLFWYYRLQGRKTGGRWSSSVRAGDWKLIEFHDNGTRELYNLREDPGETRNRAEAFPEIADRLARQLADWRKGAESGRCSRVRIGAVRPLDGAAP